MRGWSVAGVAAARCLLCEGASDALVCTACSADLPWNRQACPQCARPVPAPMSLCAGCARRPPPFDATFAAFRYEAPIKNAIQRLKYNADFLAVRWLAERLAESLAPQGSSQAELIVPMPLHRGRLARRGYNQAQEIARVLARRSGLPLAPELAKRTRATEDQIGKSAVERRRNLRGAFAVDAGIAGRSVAIVDDVFTTGSTAAELARACRKAGANRVEVWVLARVE